MSFARNISTHIEGITVRAPLKYRHLDGMIADVWVAEGRKGAGGYYLSPNPRIVIFADEVGHSIRMTNQERAGDLDHRPMGRAVYIPPGMPMWSRFTSSHAFRHLDLYMDERVILNMLTPRLGASAAQTALRKPVEVDDSDTITQLANMVSAEVAAPRHHALHAESLIQGIVTGMLVLPEEEVGPHSRLSEAQMRRLRSHCLANIGRRISNAELAAEARLSESWFAHMFKQTTGETPQQWQTRLRVERARETLGTSEDSLADIAQTLGFADQAHLTRVFRAATGLTPAVWRRRHAG